MSSFSIINSVDAVLLTLAHHELHVMLCRRTHPPFEGQWCLPGGFIHAEEDVDAEDAALRVLREKVSVHIPWLEQLATFTGPGRDPRGWSVSISYYALVHHAALEGVLGEDTRIVPVRELKQLPFDHRSIIDAAVDRVRSKTSYSSLPVYLCDEEFTLPQLQRVYEDVLGEPQNKMSFRRKINEMGILEPVIGATYSKSGANRPAQVYRLKKQFARSLFLRNRVF